MNRFLLPLGLFGLLVVVLWIGVVRSPEKSNIPSPLIGKPAPEFRLPSLTDPATMVDSKDLRGQWYVFNVWGTWCPGCRTEHPALVAIQRTTTVPLIGLNWKDDDAQALEWLAQLGNPYKSVAVDKEGRIAIDWGVYGAPETFLVDPNGIVVHKHIGPMTQEAWETDFVPRLPADTRKAT